MVKQQCGRGRSVDHRWLDRQAQIARLLPARFRHRASHLGDQAQLVTIDGQRVAGRPADLLVGRDAPAVEQHAGRAARIDNEDLAAGAQDQQVLTGDLPAGELNMGAGRGAEHGRPLAQLIRQQITPLVHQADDQPWLICGHDFAISTGFRPVPAPSTPAGDWQRVTGARSTDSPRSHTPVLYARTRAGQLEAAEGAPQRP